MHIRTLTQCAFPYKSCRCIEDLQNQLQKSQEYRSQEREADSKDRTRLKQAAKRKLRGLELVCAILPLLCVDHCCDRAWNLAFWPASPCCVVLCCVVLCCVCVVFVLCLCCVVLFLCCVVLCYVVVCYAVLCYFVL